MSPIAPTNSGDWSWQSKTHHSDDGRQNRPDRWPNGASPTSDIVPKESSFAATDQAETMIDVSLNSQENDSVILDRLEVEEVEEAKEVEKALFLPLVANRWRPYNTRLCLY